MSKNTTAPYSPIGLTLRKLPPHLVLYGNLYMGTVLGICLGLSALIRYPDVVSASVTLNMVHPPVPVMARETGRIQALLVTDKQTVRPEQPLAILENTADYRAVLQLEAKIKKLDGPPDAGISDNKATGTDSSFSQVLDEFSAEALGEIQPSYLACREAFMQKRLHGQLQTYESEKRLLDGQQQEHHRLLEKQKRQLGILTQEYDLVRADHERNRRLYQQKVISAKEWESIQMELLAVKRNMENLSGLISDNRIRQKSLGRNLIAMQSEGIRQTLALEIGSSQKKKELLLAISDWKRKYLLSSPTHGRVSFHHIYAPNQTVQKSDEVFHVLASTRQGLVGRLVMSNQGAGKVRLNQNVVIHLDDYPFEEFGVLRGKVAKISLLPIGNNYVVEVNGIVGDRMPDIRQGMSGQAQIITMERSLLGRMVNLFRGRY